ncbi:response regulator [Chitinophagaceae bacterium LB-8]|jgi:CheY-like chemotaxis protein|uniref:Response regulator n=1 Tax=Paraflavisolibacter caeni TaxID=2982496 RepID=A0A9X3BJW3_9BACT|nr:response regulator [Paraflavisolibacter caeni]MCU7551723.1 response regulator [Paraflavisolibacter caeni]
MKTQHTRQHHILWADDDNDDLMLMREALEGIDHHHQITEANNGREVLDHLGSIEDPSQFPCLIILDMNMPILNGRETLAILKSEEKYSSIPVVVFTTSSSEMDRMFCRRFGVEMFTKPDDFVGHQQMIQQLLRFCSICKESVATEHCC